MRFCKHCNMPVDQNTSFCPNCGTPIYNSGVVQSQKEPYSTLSIVAFVLSLTVSALGGLICGIIDKAIHKNSKHNFSVAAIIISSIRLFLSVALITLYIIFGLSFLSFALGMTDSSLDNTYSYSDNNSEEQAPLIINIPEEKIEINQYNYDDDIEITFDVFDVSYEVTDYTFSDLCMVKFTFTSTMTMNESHLNSNYVKLTYTLTDSTDVIVDKGTAFVGPLSVGETMKDSFSTINLEKGKEYTLNFEDYMH